jgi:hypothetical protein
MQRDRLFNLLSLVMLGMTLLVIGYYILIAMNPYTPLNPFPPAQRTLAVVATLTPTVTPPRKEAATWTPTATPTITPTPPPSFTPHRHAHPPHPHAHPPHRHGHAHPHAHAARYTLAVSLHLRTGL